MGHIIIIFIYFYNNHGITMEKSWETYFQQFISIPQWLSHGPHMLMGFLLVHGTIAGDFRRAVKSLARQGRLEEAEDKNRKSASDASDVGAVWSAQFTWRCSWRCWFKNYICGLWMFMGGYCYRMIYWNHWKWWFTEVLWWFNWILW